MSQRKGTLRVMHQEQLEERFWYCDGYKNYQTSIKFKTNQDIMVISRLQTGARNTVLDTCEELLDLFASTQRVSLSRDNNSHFLRNRRVKDSHLPYRELPAQLSSQISDCLPCKIGVSKENKLTTRSTPGIITHL